MNGLFLLSWVCLLDFNDVVVRQWRCSSGSSHRFIYRMLCCMFIPTCHRQPECLRFDADFFFNATIIAVHHGDRTSMCVSLCWDQRFCCFLPSYTLTYPRLNSTQLEMFGRFDLRLTSCRKEPNESISSDPTCKTSIIRAQIGQILPLVRTLQLSRLVLQVQARTFL